MMGLPLFFVWFKSLRHGQVERIGLGLAGLRVAHAAVRLQERGARACAVCER